jgi:spermidine synthase
LIKQITLAIQLEEDLADDLKWSMLVKQVLYSGKSKFQEVDLIDVGPFGKVKTCTQSQII